ncbi:MAG TPA: hypothetical protein VGP62_05145 [Bryobacteraceae bacterium]|jgi:hypothetical protein|nr:hypothetical protein [Bryobacteraceae bacterium]
MNLSDTTLLRQISGNSFKQEKVPLFLLDYMRSGDADDLWAVSNFAFSCTVEGPDTASIPKLRQKRLARSQTDKRDLIEQSWRNDAHQARAA